jgi:ABC-type amino acid transport substrate-binding protein
MSRSGGRGFAPAAIAALSVTAGVFAGTASAGTLDRIGRDKSIRIAYRDDAPPFSYKDKIGEPVGFMLDLCCRSPKSSPTSCT